MELKEIYRRKSNEKALTWVEVVRRDMVACDIMADMWNDGIGFVKPTPSGWGKALLLLLCSRKEQHKSY